MLMQPQTAFTKSRKIDLVRPATPPAIHAPLTRFTGVVAGAMVETDAGWCPVERLSAGSLVHTYDGGMRPVRRLDRAWLLPGEATMLIEVPGGVLDTCAGFRVVAEQHLLLETAAAEALLGDPRLLLPAAVLVGHRGIRRAPVTCVTETVTLIFDEEEIVFVNSGALVHFPGRDTATASRSGDGAGAGADAELSASAGPNASARNSAGAVPASPYFPVSARLLAPRMIAELLGDEATTGPDL